MSQNTCQRNFKTNASYCFPFSMKPGNATKVLSGNPSTVIMRCLLMVIKSILPELIKKYLIIVPYYFESDYCFVVLQSISCIMLFFFHLQNIFFSQIFYDVLLCFVALNTVMISVFFAVCLRFFFLSGFVELCNNL